MWHGGEAGLTLVEMLVVLAIVATAAGATVLGLGAATRGPGAEAEARRLAATIQAAADEAAVSDRALRIEWDAQGYRVPAAEGDAGERHALPGGMTLAGGTRSLPLSTDGAGVPMTLTLRAPGRSWTIAFDGLRATAVPGA